MSPPEPSTDLDRLRRPAAETPTPGMEDLLSAAGVLAGQGFGGAVNMIRDTHRAISGRVFWALNLAGRPMELAAAPARVLHDAISTLAYGTTGAVGEVVARIAGDLSALAGAGQEAGSRARILLGVINGIYGDRLAAENSALATQMFARVDTSAGPALRSGSLTDGRLTPRLAVFVHGLCETEESWFLWRRRGPGYGERLRVGLGYTPVYVRYNSGRAIAENGQLLADLIEELVAEAPIEIQEIALIGHSMGGLVARQALSRLTGTPTGRRIRHMVLLGTPHRGAPLEVAAEAAARVLAWAPETRPLAEMLGVRSVGIKDLRYGATERCDQDVEHYFFSTGLGRGLEPSLGDLLVGRLSAWDSVKGERLPFDLDHYRHLGDATHFDLLGHPAIGEQMVRWLGGPGLLEASSADPLPAP